MSDTKPSKPGKSSPKKQKPRLVTWDKIPNQPEGDSANDPVKAIDWSSRAGSGRGLLRSIERVALLAKEPIDRLVGTTRLNPLYYSDTIAFFLLVVVLVSGVYILMFFQYGYDVSYQSIQSMDRFFVSRAARTIHRYASGGLLIFSVLHAVRMLFMDRFRGPRWLAWVGGVVTVLIFWLAGVTGYWLLWDQGAQLITQSVLNLLGPLPGLAAAFYFSFLAEGAADQRGWLLMLLILLAHLGLTAIAGVFYWLHIKRLSRPRFLPPVYWMAGMGALLVIAGLFFPARQLPQANFSQLPQTTPLDPMFLFYLPPALHSASGAIWISVGILAVAGVAAAIPWLFPRQKLEPVTITPQRCTGCKHCVADCPYGALTMVPRTDDSIYELVAVVNESRCVSCGICIGSCDTLAISMADLKPESLWQDVANRLARANHLNPEQPVKVVFTCERHAAHSQRTYLQATESEAEPSSNETHLEIVPVTCVAMVNPGLITHTVDAGAAEVQVVGCPPNDCTNREGNIWMEERLKRTRAPRLKPSFQDAPIFTTWLAPDHFRDALPLHADNPAGEVQQSPSTFEQIMAAFNRRNLIIAVIVLTVGLLLQVRLTYTPYNSAATTQAVLQLAVRSSAEQLTLTVDEQPLLKSNSGSIYHRIPLSPGEHQVRLTATSDQNTIILIDEAITLSQGQVLPLDFNITP